VADHPDREQLAAFEAGDGDRRQRAHLEAHLAGCPSCAEVVASVGRAREGLALLQEPDLPPGLHDRVAAAVEREMAAAAAEGDSASRDRRPAAAILRPPSRDRRTAEDGVVRRLPWYRRPVAWGAAAALLLAALVVPFLDLAGDDLSTAGGGSAGGDTAQEAATPGVATAGGGVPVLRIPGEVSVAAIRSRLATDARAKAALDSAARDSQGAPPAGQSLDQPGGEAYRSSAPTAKGGAGGAASLEACLPAATAAAAPATRPLVPAFYVEGSHKGRDATVLVTTSRGEPGRVDLWVFPRGDCSAAPLDTDQVR
jgi:hypothetical protein